MSSSRAMMDKLYNAINALPNIFNDVVGHIDGMNIKNPIDIDNGPINDDPWDEPEITRDVSFRMTKLSDGSMRLELDFTTRDESISLNADVLPGSDHEIQNLHVSGIQPSTLDDNVDDEGWQ